MQFFVILVVIIFMVTMFVIVLCTNKKIIICRGFVEENQLQFTCHLKCGTTLSDQECVYEQVEVSGNFRRWSSETRKNYFNVKKTDRRERE